MHVWQEYARKYVSLKQGYYKILTQALFEISHGVDPYLIEFSFVGNVHSIRFGQKKSLSGGLDNGLGAMGAWNLHAGLVYHPPMRTPTSTLCASSSVRCDPIIPEKQIITYCKSLHYNSAQARPPDILQRPYPSFTVRVHTRPPEPAHTPRSDLFLTFFLTYFFFATPYRIFAILHVAQIRMI